MKTSRFFIALPLFFLLTSSVCNPAIETDKDRADKAADVAGAKGTWTGKLITEYSGDIRYFNLETSQENVVYKEAGQPAITPDGNVLTLTAKFPKANQAIQQADANFNNVKTLLDLSDGWIGGSIHGFKMSPDGKYLAVSITSFGDYKIKDDAVIVFDLQGNIVKQYEHKYQPDWTPDGKLVMAGSIMSNSVDGKVYTKTEPGIFITDKDFTSLIRIDPGFDEPAPANVAVSPDGTQVAFVKNQHVWVMKLDGSAVRQLTASGGDNQESFPAWSPDGKYIACWSYKTFERSYYTAIAIVPADAKTAIALTNEAAVWPRDGNKDRISGGAHQMSWVKQ